MVIEAKDIPPLERLRPFFFSWFRFLTVPGGKGCFYLFYGEPAPEPHSASCLSHTTQ